MVEVADGSLHRDRGVKWSAYARSCVPVYWILNLIDRQVEVYSQPVRGRYRSTQIYQPGQDAPVVIAGAEVVRIAVNDVLP